ncbi:MAG: ABC transporter ATP-binding protein [Desulfarculaceae bacterium]|nr:ABC transporter ATP-binding protein [Desulfarculaceae bacterium]
MILQVENLAVSFSTDGGTVRAVDRVGFELEKGGTLGVVGESGCGKSVTALSIMRLLPIPAAVIESGRIVFQGEDLLSYPPEKMARIRGGKIAMIFQEPMTALNPVHKIGGQIKEMYMLHQPSMTGEQMHKEALRMLDMVGIADPIKVLGLYPHHLSGGMRQRVMIAMALAARPDILIADEPTTALDVTVQAQILELIKKLQQEYAMSVLLITHDLGVIAEYCDRALVMYAGRVAEKAEVRHLFKNPSHPYTQGLLASIPSLAGKRKTELTTISGTVPSLKNLPHGCRFSNRCPHRMEVCVRQAPDRRVVSGDHTAACYLVRQGEGQNAHA